MFSGSVSRTLAEDPSLWGQRQGSSRARSMGTELALIIHIHQIPWAGGGPTQRGSLMLGGFASQLINTVWEIQAESKSAFYPFFTLRNGPDEE